MPEQKSSNAQHRLEEADALRETQTYVLKLFVSGSTPRSLLAIENIRRICDEHLRGRYQLQVIDIYQQPQFAKSEQIIAAPTLIKKLPAPLRRFVGDLSDEEKVLVGLDLLPAHSGE